MAIDTEETDQILARLAALEEHRNATQLAMMALALHFDERRLGTAGRDDLIGALRQAAAAMTAKGEPHGSDLLLTMADALASAPRAGEPSTVQ